VTVSPTLSARILTSIGDIPAAQWDALIPSGSHPFLTHRFLHACEASGSATSTTGWTPRHIVIEDDSGTPLAAMPLYAKTHSQGEYVFDHAWADAYGRAGGHYYPKLQCSIPFTPASGPRLLAPTRDLRLALLSALVQATEDWEMSSAHLTFLDTTDRASCEEAGFLIREDRQFHFIDRDYGDFDGFLASLASRKRKNIRKERARAQDGVTIHRLSGDDLNSEHWDAFYRFYLDTGERKWGRPYFTRDFFDRMQQTLRDDIVLVMAEMDGEWVAGALNYIGSDALYGRNWGTLIDKPFLHFELCYYQAIDAALERGIPRVEAGAQGEHKLARGYEPVVTTSAHYLAHPGLRDAVGDYLKHEKRAVGREVDILARHTPFRKGELPSP